MHSLRDQPVSVKKLRDIISIEHDYYIMQPFRNNIETTAHQCTNKNATCEDASCDSANTMHNLSERPVLVERLRNIISIEHNYCAERLSQDVNDIAAHQCTNNNDTCENASCDSANSLTIVDGNNGNQHNATSDMTVLNRKAIFGYILENSCLKTKLNKQKETILNLRKQVNKFKKQKLRLVNKIRNTRSFPTLDLEDDVKEVISHVMNPQTPYNHSIRCFSLVLSCMSKRAYRWIRKKLSNRLPSLRTLRSWFSKSDINTAVGFNKQTLITLKSLADVEKVKGKCLYVSLCFDEMAMRRHMQWIHSKKVFSGLTTHGKRESDNISVANNVLFFLVTSLELKYSLVLGYFLIRSLSKIEKASLLSEAIRKIDETGACLVSIAFDGLITNFSAFEHLGASFKQETFKPFILDKRNERICLVLDPPHMLKLVRNCLGDKGHIVDGDDRDISWEYFVRLVQRKSDLATHKMTRKHIEFSSNKMNVRLAAETLSLSVANSMEYFRKKRDRNFIEASGTITFIKNFNKAFDIFNAKHSDSHNKFKQGLTKENANEILVFLHYLTDYIKSLKLDGINILKSARNTAFLGFLINSHTINFLYEHYVAKGKIDIILFFYLGQDNLECLFSRLRSMLGFNDNPTAEQLSGILRQIIAFQELTAPENANCQDRLNILSVNSAWQPTIPNISTELPIVDQRYLIADIELNNGDLYTIKIRAGAIEKKIRYSKLVCTNEECEKIFIINEEKIEGTFFENLKVQRPTKSTVKICELIYKFFSIQQEIYHFDYNDFHRKVLSSIQYDNLFNNIDFSHEPCHKSMLILLIIDEYVRIHATHIAHKFSIDTHSTIMGNHAKKLKLNLGQ